MNQSYAATAVVLLAIGGLAASNVLHDRGVPNRVSRVVAPVIGGGAFLIAVLWLDFSTAITVSGAMALFIIVLRLGFRRGLRGVRGELRSQAWAEVTYVIAGTAGLAIGWGLLGDRWLAFVPIAFMAWGDSTVGLTRSTILRGELARVWPSVAMLCVCLGVAVLYQPYWIGATGALAATAAERFRPTAHAIWDDNWAVVGAALGLMGLLSAAHP